MNRVANYRTAAFAAVAVVLSSASGSAKSATPEAEDGRRTSYRPPPIPAPAQAFELTLAIGYTRGFGTIDNGARDIAEHGGAGPQLDLGVGYRGSPHMMIGATFAYQFYSAGDVPSDGGKPAGVLMRVDATFHLSPHAGLEPWLKAGAGYRYLRECYEAECRPGLHGPELLGVTTGTDLRLDERLAVAPMVGADLNVFLWDGSGRIADPRPNTFVYVGVQVRLDVGA